MYPSYTYCLLWDKYVYFFSLSLEDYFEEIDKKTVKISFLAILRNH